MKFKTSVFTDKGVVKTKARQSIMKHIEKDPSAFFAHAQKVEGMNTYTVQIPDADGRIVYVNFDISVSAKNPADRADRKSKSKAATSNDVEVE